MFCPPPPAHRVFARRQRRAHSERRRRRSRADGCGRGGGHAGGRAHRPEQPVRDGEVLSRGAGGGREADHRRRPARARAGRAQRAFALVLLCQNDVGYRNLTRLVSRSYLEGQQQAASRRSIATGSTPTTSSGLIALVGRARRRRRPRDRARPRRRGAPGARAAGSRCSAIATTSSCSARVAKARSATSTARSSSPSTTACRSWRPTTCASFAREDFEAHEARVCIHDGALLGDRSGARRYSEEQYLKSPREMAELFADVPEAIENSVEIARRCNLELKLGKSVLPAYPVPAAISAPKTTCARSRGAACEMRLEQLRKRRRAGRARLPARNTRSAWRSSSA